MNDPVIKLEEVFDGFSFQDDSHILPKKSRLEGFQTNLKSSQQKRRDDLIKKQKENRTKSIQALREKLKNKRQTDELIEMSYEPDDSNHDSMEIEMIKNVDKREAYLVRKYRDILMLPELLDEIPEDFSKYWSAVPYPNGIRCSVIAGNGKTDSRSESGIKLCDTFESLIPGGSYRSTIGSRSIFDCIFVEKEKTFYVLDLIMWKGLDFIDCECECRFFMRNSRLEEIDHIHTIRKGNDYIFKPLKYYLCNKEGLKKAREENGFLEGMLFFHNEANYISERNPLMCGLSKEKINSLIDSMD